jgi:hypothetical protein
MGVGAQEGRLSHLVPRQQPYGYEGDAIRCAKSVPHAACAPTILRDPANRHLPPHQILVHDPAMVAALARQLYLTRYRCQTNLFDMSSVIFMQALLLFNTRSGTAIVPACVFRNRIRRARIRCSNQCLPLPP